MDGMAGSLMFESTIAHNIPYAALEVSPGGFPAMVDCRYDHLLPWNHAHQFASPGSPGNQQLVSDPAETSVPGPHEGSVPGSEPRSLNQMYSPVNVSHSAHTHPVPFSDSVPVYPGNVYSMPYDNQDAVPAPRQDSAVPVYGHVNYNPEPGAGFVHRHSASTLESVQDSAVPVYGHVTYNPEPGTGFVRRHSMSALESVQDSALESVQDSAVSVYGHVNYNPESGTGFVGRHSMSALESVQDSSTPLFGHTQSMLPHHFGSYEFPLVRSEKVATPGLHERARSMPPSPGRVRGSYVSQACENCRQKKTRCTGEHTGCKRCKTRNIACCYSKAKRGKARS